MSPSSVTCPDVITYMYLPDWNGVIIQQILRLWCQRQQQTLITRREEKSSNSPLHRLIFSWWHSLFNENDIKTLNLFPKHKMIRKSRQWKCPDVVQTWQKTTLLVLALTVIIPGLRQSWATLSNGSFVTFSLVFHCINADMSVWQTVSSSFCQIWHIRFTRL